MPFVPNTVSAVILYGKKTCNHLIDILNYWQTILTDHAWDRYLFLCITTPEDNWQFPGEGELLPGTQELIDKQVIHCMHFPLDENKPESWSMPRLFLEELHFRLSIGNVMVHCVCDDLRDSPPIQAAMALTKSASLYLGKSNVTTLYYVMLRESYESRQKQRELAISLHENQPRSALYLLSRVANDGARVHKFELWRAMMCEILVASAGKRSYVEPFVYSLGYTSLNANDQELFFLRRHTIAELLRRHYDEPIPDAEAWNILTLESNRFSFESNPYAINAAVAAWVESIVTKYIIQPSVRELNNLRILADANKPEKAAGLQEIIKKFFEANITARTERMLQNHAEKHVSEVLKQLRTYINAKEFPEQLLAYVLTALESVSGTTANYIPAPIPKKHFLESTDDYLAKYSRMVSDSIRQYYLTLASAKLAKYLVLHLGKFKAALNQMKKQEQFNHALQEFRLPSSEEDRLKTKYAHYATAIADTINEGSMTLFGQQWTQSLSSIYNDDYIIEEDVLKQLVAIGEETLHKHLPSGFNGTFMDALHAEFPTVVQMTAFLNKYLYIKRHMFHCPLATYNTEDSVYFVDDDLQYTPWAKNNAEKSIIVDNDNIEQLSFVHIGKDLHWLAVEWQNENRYFGNHKEWSFSGSDHVGWIGSASAVHAAKPQEKNESTGEAQLTDDSNPRKIRLTLTPDNRFILSWEWEDGMKHLLVKIGNNPVRPCSVSEYLLTGGFDVTDLLSYGKNDIALFYSGGHIYGKISLSGKRHPVQYRFLPSAKGGVQLRVYGSIPPTGTLLLGEMQNKDTLCFYPVASRGINGLQVYDGLMLAGKYQLMISPEDRFPFINPVQNISL